MPSTTPPRPPPPASAAIPLADRLAKAGVRPTSKRLALGALLFDGGHRHVTAEKLWLEAQAGPDHVSLATVYNTLNEFVEAGLLRLVDIPAARGVFDTNVAPHHHLLDETTGQLHDLPSELIGIDLRPGSLPDAASFVGVDVVVRIRS